MSSSTFDEYHDSIFMEVDDVNRTQLLETLWYNALARSGLLKDFNYNELIDAVEPSGRLSKAVRIPYLCGMGMGVTFLPIGVVLYYEYDRMYGWGEFQRVISLLRSYMKWSDNYEY
jgi:hypothetical protein